MSKVLTAQFRKLTGKVQPRVSMGKREALFREARWSCVRFDGAYWTDVVVEDAYKFWESKGKPRNVIVVRVDSETFALVRRTNQNRERRCSSRPPRTT